MLCIEVNILYLSRWLYQFIQSTFHDEQSKQIQFKMQINDFQFIAH